MKQVTYDMVLPFSSSSITLKWPLDASGDTDESRERPSRDLALSSATFTDTVCAESAVDTLASPLEEGRVAPLVAAILFVRVKLSRESDRLVDVKLPCDGVSSLRDISEVRLLSACTRVDEASLGARDDCFLVCAGGLVDAARLVALSDSSGVTFTSTPCANVAFGLKAPVSGNILHIKTLR